MEEIAILAALRKFWSFVTTPPWSYVSLAAVVALAIWLYGVHEYRAGEAACEASHRVASQHEVVRQVDAGKQAQGDSNRRTAPHRAQAAKNKETVQYVYLHDQALPDGDVSCVEPDDADRLRGLK